MAIRHLHTIGRKDKGTSARQTFTPADLPHLQSLLARRRQEGRWDQPPNKWSSRGGAAGINSRHCFDICWACLSRMPLPSLSGMTDLPSAAAEIKNQRQKRKSPIVERVLRGVLCVHRKKPQAAIHPRPVSSSTTNPFHVIRGSFPPSATWPVPTITYPSCPRDVAGSPFSLPSRNSFASQAEA